MRATWTLSRGDVASPRELTGDPAFARRVVRLTAVSAVALGLMSLLWRSSTEAPRVLDALLVAGWVTMPLLLAASLHRPRLRIALTAPALLVAAPVTAAALGAPGVDTPAQVGWGVVAVGLWLGMALGGWLWYRLLPVPAPLDNPFSRARWVLIAGHVSAIVCGLAIVLAVLVTR